MAQLPYMFMMCLLVCSLIWLFWLHDDTVVGDDHQNMVYFCDEKKSDHWVIGILFWSYKGHFLSFRSPKYPDFCDPGTLVIVISYGLLCNSFFYVIVADCLTADGSNQTSCCFAGHINEIITHQPSKSRDAKFDRKIIKISLHLSFTQRQIIYFFVISSVMWEQES